MNRSIAMTARGHLAAIRNSIKGMAGKVGAAVAGMTVAGSAAASDSLGATALAQIQTLNSDVKAILVILVGVVFLFVLYSFVKRAK